MKSFISQLEKHRKIGKYFSPKSTPENTHGLSQKIQGTYFKISALYFKIYGLYFLQDALCFSERPQTTEKMRGKTCEKIRRHVEKSVKCVYVQGEKRIKPFQNNGKYAQCRFF